VSLGGIYIAWALFLRSRAALAAVMRQPVFQSVHRFWLTGWGFDWMYDHVFVQPLVWFAAVDKRDGLDRIYDGLAWSSRAAWRALSDTETGRVRQYAAGLTIGALVITTIVIFL
jgi:NADH-quinone oxidoreductase subunit L